MFFPISCHCLHSYVGIKGPCKVLKTMLVTGILLVSVFYYYLLAFQYWGWLCSYIAGCVLWLKGFPKTACQIAADLDWDSMIKSSCGIQSLYSPQVVKIRNIKTQCIKDRTQLTCGHPHSWLAGHPAMSSGNEAELSLEASGELGVSVEAANACQENARAEQGIQGDKEGLLLLTSQLWQRLICSAQM